MTDLRKVSKMKFPFLDAKAKLIRIMGTFDLATGHGDTMDELLDSLESELRDVLGHYREALRQALAMQKFSEVNQEIEEALKQPQQEPVGYVTIETISSWAQVPSIKWFKKPTEGPLYTAPPKREWVGLTDEEVDEIYMHEGHEDVVLLTQAKLKEKNT